MKKYIILIQILLVSIFLYSCKNDADFVEQTSYNNKLGEKYLKILKSKKAEGSVLIQSNTSKLMQNEIRNINISEKNSNNYRTKGNSRINFIDFNKNEYLNKTNETSKELFFGKTLKYTINTSSTNSKTENNSSDVNEVYIPELLTIYFSTDELMPGTVINWNVDDMNENGVAVLLEYNSINQPNIRLANENPQSIRRSFVLPDMDGTYTVKLEDLNIFPNKAAISVNIIRAGYNSDENDLSVIGLTNVNNEMKMIK